MLNSASESSRMAFHALHDSCSMPEPWISALRPRVVDAAAFTMRRMTRSHAVRDELTSACTSATLPLSGTGSTVTLWKIGPRLRHPMQMRGLDAPYVRWKHELQNRPGMHMRAASLLAGYRLENLLKHSGSKSCN
jgi:hypothetical protein